MRRLRTYGEQRKGGFFCFYEIIFQRESWTEENGEKKREKGKKRTREIGKKKEWREKKMRDEQSQNGKKNCRASPSFAALWIFEKSEKEKT